MAVGYKIRINGGALDNVVTDVGNVNTHTFTGLDYETEYAIDLKKYNGAAESAWTTPPLTASLRRPPLNVALAANGASVVVSSEYDAIETPGSALINGDRIGGAAVLTGGQNWVSLDNPTTTPQWAEITFDGEQSISQVDIIGTPTTPGYEPLCAGPTLSYDDATWAITDFKVQYWNGAAWVDIVSYVSNTNGWRKYFFSPVTTTKIRLYITNVTSGLVRAYVTEIEAWLTGRNPIVIVNDGDSRIQSSSVSAELQRLLDHNYSVQTTALSGQKLQDQLAVDDIATKAVPLYNANALNNIIIQSIGINDFGAGRSTADFQADYITWCGQARAAGFKIIACTVMPGVLSDPYPANLAAFNAWLRTNPGGIADVILDLAGDPSLDDPTDTAFYSDGVHNTSLGMTVVANLMYDAVRLIAAY
jgi:lysophospholipase L1-like esterase